MNALKLFTRHTDRCLEFIYQIYNRFASGLIDESIKILSSNKCLCLQNLSDHSDWDMALALLQDGTSICGSHI